MTNEPDDTTPPERGPRPGGAPDRLRFLARSFRVAADVLDEAATVVEGATGEPAEALIWDLTERARAVGDICHDSARALNDERNEMRLERMKK